MVIKKLEPMPNWLSAYMLPLCASTIFFAIDKPVAGAFISIASYQPQFFLIFFNYRTITVVFIVVDLPGLIKWQHATSMSISVCNRYNNFRQVFLKSIKIVDGKSSGAWYILQQELRYARNFIY